VPVIDRGPGQPAATGLHRGAYTLRDAASGQPDAVIIASGSEVGIALKARKLLADEGIGTRVVSMPSWRLFAAQSPEYRLQVLPDDAFKVSVEAGSTMGWDRWVGSGGASIGIDRFGASAPFQEIFRHYGVSHEAVCKAVRAGIAR
jgi:transketolase